MRVAVAWALALCFVSWVSQGETVTVVEYRSDTVYVDRWPQDTTEAEVLVAAHSSVDFGEWYTYSLSCSADSVYPQQRCSYQIGHQDSTAWVMK